MAVCKHDRNHVYPGHNTACPWCEQQMASSAGLPQQTPIVPINSIHSSPPSATQKSPHPTKAARRTRRGWTASIIASAAVAGILLTGIVINFVSGQDAPATIEATESVQSDAGNTELSSPEAAPPVAHAVVSPTSDLHAGVESRYSADYTVHINAVTHDGMQVHLDFTASGRSDLRRPETSCLVIDGADGQTYLARPTTTTFTVDERGSFAGSLSFPALISGTYGFQYSCASDYSIAQIGSVNVPAVGVSRFNEDYYAVVLGFDGSRVQFAAHGRSDLLNPGGSCVARDGSSYTPEVALESEWVSDAITLVGTMEYLHDVAGGTFVYSCSGYSEVTLG